MIKTRVTEVLTDTDPKTRRWKSLFAAGRMAYEAGELRQAASLLARARELANELKQHTFATNASDVGLSAILLAEGKSREAANKLQKTISHLRGSSENEMKELLGVAMRFHAEALLDMGDPREAEKELKESISILQELGIESCVQLAYTLCDLCGLYLEQDRISEAEHFITSAMQILFAVLGPESAEYSRADMIYAVCQQKEEPLEMAHDGIQRMQYMYGTRHPNVSRALNRFCKVLKDRGDTVRLAKAEERFRQPARGLKH
jgi:tetratricopeptide (TPR) repeat protein